MTFGSFYEITNTLTTVKKQSMIDWFTGYGEANYNSIDPSRFKWHALSGTNSIIGDNNIDGGLQIRSDGAAGNQATIGFNDIRQYSPTGSVCIAVTRSPDVLDSTEGTSSNVGFNDDHDHSWDGGAAKHFAVSSTYGGFTYFSSWTGNGSSGSYGHSDILLDGDWHTHKIELDTSYCHFTIDGVIKSSKTDTLPTQKMQPRFDMRDNTGGGVHTASIRYMECFNT